MTTYAVDWDGVCVDDGGLWLPGGIVWLKSLERLGHTAFVHTCRASWPEGKADVEAKLVQAGLALEVVVKPRADVYLDDRAQPFPGDWSQVPLPPRR